MKTAFNTMVKNESIMLDSVLPIWSKYPIDLFIFYDDNSTDETCNIIKKYLSKDRYIILNDHLEKFNEGYYRQKMIDESISNDVDIIFSIDADELLSSSIINDFDNFLKIYENTDLWLYWYNVVNDSLDYHRADPAYVNNYRSFVLPVKHINRLDTSAWQYHTPRTPHVNLPKSYTKEYGVIHLQSCNKKYYAIKQLWYKHYEYLNYNHSVGFINGRYDSVVNNLNFNPTLTDKKIIEGIEIDLSFFNDLEKSKGYLSFINENLNNDLITFGKEFL